MNSALKNDNKTQYFIILGIKESMSSWIQQEISLPTYSECLLKNVGQERDHFYINQKWKDDQTLCFILVGPLSFKTEKFFREAIKQETEKNHCSKIEIHFGDVSFMDSIGFAALISVLRMCHREKKALYFSALPQDLMHFFLLSPLACCVEHSSFREKSRALLNKKILTKLDEGIFLKEDL